MSVIHAQTSFLWIDSYPPQMFKSDGSAASPVDPFLLLVYFISKVEKFIIVIINNKKLNKS